MPAVSIPRERGGGPQPKVKALFEFLAGLNPP